MLDSAATPLLPISMLLSPVVRLAAGTRSQGRVTAAAGVRLECVPPMAVAKSALTPTPVFAS